MQTDSSTSGIMIAFATFFGVLARLSASEIIQGLTIISLLLVIPYHAFGLYERWKNIKKDKNGRS